MTDTVNSADSKDLSELRMAVMYGSEGLKRSTETEDYDDWLKLFGDVLEQLERPRKKGRRNFPLKEAAIPQDDKRERIVSDLEFLRDTAEKIDSRDIDERGEMDATISEAIEVADEIYDILDESQTDGKMALKAD